MDTHNEVKEIKHLSNDIKTVHEKKEKIKKLIKMSRMFYGFVDRKPFEANFWLENN